jgi:ABC-type transport system substrate-binding protein
MTRQIPRISRRLLMRGGVAAGLLMATGVHAAERRVAGVLRIAVETLPDPVTVLLAGDCLTEVTAEGTLVGELAESWDSAEAVEWVFRIRAGVVDHDGVPFGAAEAAAALWAARAALPDIVEVASEGPDLRVRLAAADADFPFRLADPALVLRAASGAGTGLYRPEDEGRLARVARHYKDGRAGWFEAVEVIAIAEAGARSEAVLSGAVDVALGTPVEPRLAMRRGVGQAAGLLYRTRLGRPGVTGSAAFDDGRIGERWWVA